MSIVEKYNLLYLTTFVKVIFKLSHQQKVNLRGKNFIKILRELDEENNNEKTFRHHAIPKK